jgi:hypothetical protein
MFFAVCVRRTNGTPAAYLRHLRGTINFCLSETQCRFLPVRNSTIFGSQKIKGDFWLPGNPSGFLVTKKSGEFFVTRKSPQEGLQAAFLGLSMIFPSHAQDWARLGCFCSRSGRVQFRPSLSCGVGFMGG